MKISSDIRAKRIDEVNASFNIIQHSIEKNIIITFPVEKSHPFNAPLIRDFGHQLDIERMKEAALLFKGKPNFKRYASKPQPNTVFEREILVSEILTNERIKANFIPTASYIYRVKSEVSDIKYD